MNLGGAVVRLVGSVRYQLRRKRLPEFSGLKAIVRLALECEHDKPVRLTAALGDGKCIDWCEVCGACCDDTGVWTLPYTARLAHKWAGERRGKWINRAV